MSWIELYQGNITTKTIFEKRSNFYKNKYYYDNFYSSVLYFEIKNK